MAPLAADAFRHRGGVAFGAVEADDVAPPGMTTGDPPLDLRADTGNLAWNRSDGILRIDTPRTTGAVGFLGGRALEVGAVRLEIETPVCSRAGARAGTASRSGSAGGCGCPGTPCRIFDGSEPHREVRR